MLPWVLPSCTRYLGARLRIVVSVTTRHRELVRCDEGLSYWPILRNPDIAIANGMIAVREGPACPKG